MAGYGLSATTLGLSAMKVLLTSLGTGGDVFPYIGLGAVLRARGHRVVLAANAQFRAAAEAEGLEFVSLMSQEQMDEFLNDPDLWHPLKSSLVGARMGRDYIAQQYECLLELFRDRPDAIVASPAVPAARFLQELHGVPLISVLMQPWMIPSLTAPPAMPGGWTLPRWAPRPVGRLYWWSVDTVADVLIGRHFNRFRRTINLPAVRRLFRWWLSPQRVLGFFPAAYCEPQADWPGQLRLTGFPMYDGQSETALDQDLLSYLQSGEPPVAVTFGTGMRHAGKVFQHLAEICADLGRRALFLTTHREQLPSPLPSHVRHCDFAPFLALLPHCGLLVHHGGIGTVAKALVSGTPQLILHFAFDQPDNGRHVRRLGVGDYLGRGASKRRIAHALAPLLSAETRSRCVETAARIGVDDGLVVAAREIEQLANGAPSEP